MLTQEKWKRNFMNLLIFTKIGLTMSSHLWSPSGSGNAAGVVEDIFQWILSSKSVFSVPNQAKNRFSNILLLFLFLPLQGVRSTVTNRKFENVAGKCITFWKRIVKSILVRKFSTVTFLILIMWFKTSKMIFGILRKCWTYVEAHARVCSLVSTQEEMWMWYT